MTQDNSLNIENNDKTNLSPRISGIFNGTNSWVKKVISSETQFLWLLWQYMTIFRDTILNSVWMWSLSAREAEEFAFLVDTKAKIIKNLENWIADNYPNEEKKAA